MRIPIPHLPRPKAPSKQTVDALKKIPSIRSTEDLLDVAMEVPATRVDEAVAALIEADPNATIAELEERATRNYRRRSARYSGVVGAGAAFPGAGTAVATALTVGELLAFYTNTTVYVLTMAKLHGISPDSVEQRRLMVSSALLGEEGARVVADQLGLGTLMWARGAWKNVSSPALGAANKYLAKYAAKKTASSAAKRSLGRLLPFGVGAVVGYFSGLSTAKRVIEGVRAALGPAPERTAVSVRDVIDVEAR